MGSCPCQHKVRSSVPETSKDLHVASEVSAKLGSCIGFAQVAAWSPRSCLSTVERWSSGTAAACTAWSPKDRMRPPGLKFYQTDSISKDVAFETSSPFMCRRAGLMPRNFPQYGIVGIGSAPDTCNHEPSHNFAFETAAAVTVWSPKDRIAPGCVEMCNQWQGL